MKHIVNGLAMEDFAPCALHMEMQVDKKPPFGLFLQGMDRCPDGDFKTRAKFVAMANECVNSQALGDVTNGRCGQWKLPLKDSGKQVEPRSMSGMTSGKCVVGLENPIQTTFGAELDERLVTPQHTRANTQVEVVAVSCDAPTDDGDAEKARQVHSNGDWFCACANSHLHGFVCPSALWRTCHKLHTHHWCWTHSLLPH